MARKPLSRVWGMFVALFLLAWACNLPALTTPLASVPTATPAAPTAAPATSQTSQPADTPVPTVEPVSPVPLSQGPRFAMYREMAGDVVPVMNHDAISADLSNVSNPFVLSEGQRARLAQNGFVVSPGEEKEFFTLYEKARYDNVPVFVTSDSLLHVYHLLFNKVLRTAETVHFIPMLNALNQAMVAKSDEIFQSLQGTSWEDAARRTVAYFGVGSRLLDPNAQVPPYAADLVQSELTLIEQAAGIQPSPIFPGLENGEDYTQYIPRGHYTKSEALKAYFKSMMWYGRMTFRLKARNPDVGRSETRSALLLVYALRSAQVNGRPALDAWADLYSPTVFFVGRSDDLTVVQYEDVINYVYGADAGLTTIADDSRLDQFIELANQLPPPKILGIVIVDTDDEEALTKGLRFMGQRFVPDAYIFRQLIYRNVGTREHRRGLPKGLDVMAAMGSERAYQILDTSGDTSYENYPQQMEKVRSWLSGLSVDDWTETLYNTWLYTFFPLLDLPGDGYPAFMKTQAWQDKQLNTSLGSWAELKHDTILYAKQVYAELGGGPPPPPPLPPRGYVEPVPVFFARLAALTEMTRTGLESRGLLTEQDREGLQRLEELANALQAMAGKELRGEPLSDEQFERIRFYGGELENLTMLAAESEDVGPGNPVFLEEEQQAAVIADVATDPDPAGTGGSDPVVLEVGVGRINVIHAVAPIVQPDGSVFLQVVKGGVFSYYEFSWPANDRLTDEKWKQMLAESQAPPLPDWTKSFTVSDTENMDLARGVTSFQNNLTWLYWDARNAVYNLDQLTERFRAELDTLNAANRYVGHQLVSSYIRSFDLQSPNLAVVTVRETWLDKMYQYSGDYPEYSEQPIAQRGPYTLEVTYTLEFVQTDYSSYWQVTNLVYANEPPGW